jgi:hypothetical protein
MEGLRLSDKQTIHKNILMKNIKIAQILKVTDGVNASSIQLPQDVSLPDSQYPAADLWDSWVNADHDYLGKSVEGGEFMTYRIEAENGEKVTLVMFSWSQGGFDGSALVDGHPENIGEAASMWLGDTAVNECEDDHAIHEIYTAEGEEY